MSASAATIRREPELSPSLASVYWGRVRGVLGVIYPLVVAGIAWEIAARLRNEETLFPTLTDVLRAMWRTGLTGELQFHFLSTVWRLLAGFFIACLLAVPLGLLMARSRKVEGFWVPLVSFLNPIPGLAWVPIFLLWFGLSHNAVVALVIWASFPPIAINTWTGAKTINEVWVRAAESMGAQGATLFRKVVLPGSLPFVLSGMRIGLSRAWRAVIAAELLSAGGAGLGFMIFSARDFLRTDVMLAGVFAIGFAGVMLEKLLFQWVERFTVVRWGMLRDSSSL